MKLLSKKINIYIIILFISSIAVASDEPMNLLSGSYTQQDVANALLTAEEWHHRPTSSERDAWDSLSEILRKGIVTKGESLLNCEWPSLPATVFLEYVRNGNRVNFQELSFERRHMLGSLVLAECMENKGRFLDDIANGIWAICEETYWGVPAHVGFQKWGKNLPDVTEPTVDLFAAQTGSILAWTYYLLKDKLDTVSPLINERLEYEIERRIIDVCLEREDFWWMGLNKERIVNNWNPWICSNWLTCVLLVEKDQEKRVASVYKIMRCLDEFTNPYPKDGGCDEGPKYWGHAGGSLYDNLELLYSATNGKIDISDQPLIQEIGRYIYRVYIDNGYFINFADAPAKFGGHPFITYRYGKAIGDEIMQSFAAYHFHKTYSDNKPVSFPGMWLGRSLASIFNWKELNETKPIFTPDLGYWFYDLQVLTARSQAGTSKGLYLAAKGGHNKESHNHNDVGNFLVYSDGYPAVIDVGVETYTKKTFSEQRYEIWTMQSAYHNLPTINGVMQKNGRQFESTDVQYKSNKKQVQFELNLAKAYPKDAGVQSWKRQITFNRNKDITLVDQYNLEKSEKPLQYTLMTWAEPVIDKKGTLRIKLADRTDNAARDVLITYDNNSLSIDIESIETNDVQLKSVWQDKVYRILFTEKSLKSKGENKIKITQ